MKCSWTLVVLALLLLNILAGCAPSANPSLANAQTYRTTFNYAENPISNGGKWINGHEAGLDWGNVQTNTSYAFGVLQPGSNYADATAILSGTWGPTQDAQATVKVVSPPTSAGMEVEIRLRSAITAHSNTGYEILCSLNSGNPYLSVVRWNGALGDFTFLTPDAPTFCKDGDVLRATAIGNTITAYVNGVQQVQALDTTWGGGSPGIGFDAPAQSDYNKYGFSSFTATASGGH
jgi:hypothetical protein